MFSPKKYILLAVLLVAIFGLGVVIGQLGILPFKIIPVGIPGVRFQEEPPETFQIINKESGKPKEIDFSRFWDVWQKVEETYATRKHLDSQKMVYGAIAGMVKSLDDPYTVFFEPQEAKRFEDDSKGSFEGIGAEIGIKKGVLTVIAPLEETPAKKAGLMAGDKILKIDDTITADLTIEEAVRLIRGTKGTEVVLTVSRDAWTETKEIKIVRDVIKVPILKLEFKGDLAYLRLYQFTENSSEEFTKAAGTILASPAKGIVLDLRNNPGGYLDKAVDIAGWFLAQGQVVAMEDFGNGQKETFYSAGPAKLAEYKTVILVNQGSASASEILAGALKENRGLKLIGEKTYGKGSVQQLFDFNDGSSLKVTVAKWLTPNGRSISDEGLEADVKVELKAEDLEKNLDPQLDKAIELLKEQITNNK